MHPLKMSAQPSELPRDNCVLDDAPVEIIREFAAQSDEPCEKRRALRHVCEFILSWGKPAPSEDGAARGRALREARERAGRERQAARATEPIAPNECTTKDYDANH